MGFVAQIFKVGQVRHGLVQPHQIARNPREVGKFDQVFAALGLLDFACPCQQRVEITVFVDEQRGGLDPDPRHPGDVIDAVASQRLHVHHAIGADAELLHHVVVVQPLLLHRIEHADAVVDQLHQVLVRADNHHVQPGRRTLPRIGGDDVVGFKAVFLDAGEIEGAGRVPDQPELRLQILRRGVAVGLVLIVDVVAEGDAAGVENHREVVPRMVFDQPQHHGHEPAHGADRHAIGTGQRRQSVVSPEDVG